VVPLQQKQKLSEGTYSIKVAAPKVAKCIVPGQYLSVQITPDSEHIPLYVTETRNGIVSFVVTQDGPGAELTKLKKGDKIHSLCGPLGKPFAMNEFGNVIIVADNDNIGPAFFFGKAFRKAGNRVYLIARFKNKKARFWEKRLSQSFDKWTLLNAKEEVNDSIIKELSNLLRKKNIKLTIGLCDLSLMGTISHLTELRSSLYCSLLPLIKNAPGLCSECRIRLGNDTKLSCVDGPLFNGHRINWSHIDTKHKTEEQIVNLTQ